MHSFLCLSVVFFVLFFAEFALTKATDSAETSPDFSAPDKNKALLLAAVKNGDLASVRQLLNNGSVQVNDQIDEDPDNYFWANGWTALHWAATLGNIQLAKLLLQMGADASARAEISDHWWQNEVPNVTPLHMAAYNGHLDFVQLLLTNGVNVTESISNGWTALHAAVHGAQLDTVKFLLLQRDINASTIASHLVLDSFCGHVTPRRLAPIHLAANGSSLPILRLLLQRPEVRLESEDSAGWTPLYYAVLGASVGNVHALLAEGAATTRPNASRLFPPRLSALMLNAAALTEDASVTELLLLHANNSAVVNERDGRLEWTALHYACASGSETVALALLKAGADANARALDSMRPLHVAAVNGYVGIVHALLAHGAAIDARLWDERTPLMLAVGGWNGNASEVVRALLEGGAGVNLRSAEGTTALGFAAAAAAGFYGPVMDVAIVRALLEHGADVNSTDRHRASALHWAAANRDGAEIVRILLNASAQVDARLNGNTDFFASILRKVRPALERCESAKEVDKEHLSFYNMFYYAAPLHIAIIEGNLEALKALVELGNANISEMAFWDSEYNDRGIYITPLILAVYRSPPIVEYLIAQGAPLNATSSDGATALHWALDWGTNRSIIVLLEHGADVTAKDGEGRNPVHRAVYLSRTESLRVLLEHVGNGSAALNSLDRRGWSPLHYAYDNEDWESVALLLAHGADPNIVNKAGKTPKEMHDNALEARFVGNAIQVSNAIPVLVMLILAGWLCGCCKKRRRS